MYYSGPMLCKLKMGKLKWVAKSVSFSCQDNPPEIHQKRQLSVSFSCYSFSLARFGAIEKQSFHANLRLGIPRQKLLSSPRSGALKAYLPKSLPLWRSVPSQTHTHTHTHTHTLTTQCNSIETYDMRL